VTAVACKVRVIVGSGVALGIAVLVGRLVAVTVAVGIIGTAALQAAVRANSNINKILFRIRKL
jgi:F0F1-type ATP synthase membrane subunit c/vacuolar-type H+-ATPase subunit K